MVIMAGASDHHAATGKPAPPAASAAASPSPSPSPAPAKRTRLHDFAFPSWGAHRLLRCSKDGADPASPPPHPHTPSPEKEKQPHHQAAAAAATPSQPPRRSLRSHHYAAAALRSDAAGKASAPGGQARQQPLASPPTAVPRKRPFSPALTKEEIAEDFAAIRGTRPPRRPKKRPRAVQRQLDMLYPGLCLADVNLDSYKINER